MLLHLAALASASTLLIWANHDGSQMSNMNFNLHDKYQLLLLPSVPNYFTPLASETFQICRLDNQPLSGNPNPSWLWSSNTFAPVPIQPAVSFTYRYRKLRVVVAQTYHTLRTYLHDWYLYTIPWLSPCVWDAKLSVLKLAQTSQQQAAETSAGLTGPPCKSKMFR